MQDEEITLESLFKGVKKAGQQAQVKKAKEKASAPRVFEPPQTVWTNPANWKRSRYVVVIAKETQRVLGTFLEYVHTKIIGARKLEIAELPPCATADIEYISRREAVELPKLHVHKRVKVLLHLSVLRLAPTSIPVEVDLHFACSKLCEVRLEETTTFSGESGFITIPAHCDVFPVLNPAILAKWQKEFV